MTEYETVNPIAIRSKTWIVKALLELMEEKLFKDITIKEISERADLVRRTFYRNFSSKEEILDYYLEQLNREYITLLSQEKELSIHNVARIYFEFWNNHIDFLKSLEKNNLLVFLLKKYDEYLPLIHKAFKEDHLSDYPKEYVEYYVSFNVGGFWNILLKWVSEEPKKDPDEMAEMISNIMKNDF